jgi:hypothetical protein
VARGTQLITLLDDLRNEAGVSNLVSVGVDNFPAQKNLLRRTQETLYDEHDWSFLRVKPLINLAAGQQFYNYPPNLNLESINRVVVWYNNQPHPIGRGIGEAEYAQWNSNTGVRSDPVLRWDVVSTSQTLKDGQIEVWPIPLTNVMQLQFFGKRALNPLIADSDTADLDDRLITLFAAAELLARRKSADAPAKLANANARLARLKGRAQGGSDEIVMGGGSLPATRRREVVIRVK